MDSAGFSNLMQQLAKAMDVSTPVDAPSTHKAVDASTPNLLQEKEIGLVSTHVDDNISTMNMVEMYKEKAKKGVTKEDEYVESYTISASTRRQTPNSHHTHTLSVDASQGPCVDSASTLRPFTYPESFEVTVGGRATSVNFWSGQRLDAPMIGVDTETAMITAHEIPSLALASAATRDTVVLIHPAMIAEFCALHLDRTWVFHNSAFDFWVLHEHLTRAGRPDLAEHLFQMVEDGRFRDSMILDQLVRLGRDGFREPVARNLSTVAECWVGITEIDKMDPYRTRYGEIIGTDWREVEYRFFTYAAKDPIATLCAYEQMVPAAESLMQEHADEMHPDARSRFGLLTERVQVAGAVALAQIERNGIHVDAAKRDAKAAELRSNIARSVEEISACVARIAHKFPDVSDELAELKMKDIFKRDASGEVRNTRTGLPSIGNNALQVVLKHEARQAEFTPPETAKGNMVTKAEAWAPLREASKFVRAWLALRDHEQTLKYVSTDGDHVHPRYDPFKRTGRTSAKNPPIQQIPRAGGYREMFVPSPDYHFLIADYSFIECVTFAATCFVRLGRSELAEAIKAGVDPHINTAAFLNGMTLDQFTDLKAKDPALAKSMRQKAKALNFGVPGGLGAATLRDYARSNYNVEMTPEEAEQFRDRMINTVYPEFGTYLASTTMRTIASRLGCTEDALWAAMNFDAHERPEWLSRVVSKLLSGNTTKVDGSPYATSTVDRVWGGLYTCCRDDDLRSLLMTRRGGPDLVKLALDDASTITGRVRGHIHYTESRNSPFQGTAADGAKLALFYLVRAGYRIVAFIHDEVVLELPADADHAAEAARVESIMCESMRRAIFELLPVKTEYALSRCWSKSAQEIRIDDQLIPWSLDMKETNSD